ncbi:uncharacterized protein [Palaemon carinicauda]|uniref:uncharacterized protein n=1 Tax=Palaemon carinicauda TaxID=392227 RepID=UPI0035B67CC7
MDTLTKCLFMVAATIFLRPLAADGTKSIRCYTCVSTNNDLTCLNNPDDVAVGSPITDCMFADCCTIFRQEYIEQPGIVSFSRSCQPNCPKNGLYETEDSSFVTYQTYCTDPVCNIGSGDTKIDDKGDGDGGGGVIDGIIGEDGTVVNTASLSLTLLLPALIQILFMNH